MAPEQARGEIGNLDERADVFGLGAILCVILPGEPPYRAATSSEVLSLAATGDVKACFKRLDDCSAEAELVALAKNCLTPATTQRSRDAGAVANVVQRHQAGIQERLRVAELERARAEVKRAEERKRRRLALGLAGAVVLLLLLTAGAAWWIDGQRIERERQAEQARRDVEAALVQAETLRQQARWKEAGATLDLAEQRLGEDGPGDLKDKVAQARDTLALVARFDGVRQDKALFVNGKLNAAAAPAGYRAAFLAHQFDILKGDEDELVGDDKERMRLRSQALNWLRDDLTAWSKRVMEKPADAGKVRQELQRWKNEAAFALVRESKTLALLPEMEQAVWRKVWADVETLLLATSPR